MRSNLTDISILLDRSGSMESIKDDTIGGLNQFVKTQQEGQGEALVTLVQFNTDYDKIHDATPVARVEPLTRKKYQPRGATALYDALCRLIDETGARLGALAETDRPGMVIFVIVTDGQENSSSKFTMADVNERISRQQSIYKWQFVFLGANQDVMAEAGKIAIPHARAALYTPVSVRAAYNITADNVRAARTNLWKGMSVSVAADALDWTEEQRKEVSEG